MFAVARRREEFIHEPFIGISAMVREETLHLLRRRRQPGEIEVKPSRQRALVRLTRRSDSGRFEPRQRETIQRRARPSLVLHCGWLDTLHRFERPEIETLPAENTDDGIALVAPCITEALARPELRSS